MMNFCKRQAVRRVTMRRIAIVTLVLAASAVLAEDAPQREARIKDISSVEGVRENQLVGYGIVVGLHGTGDSQQTGFSTQTLASMLLRMGVSVPAASIKVQNLAAVFISATLPPFARPGTKLDVPITHINASYVRSHFDAFEVGVTDAPRADEIAHILVKTTGPRIHARAGGLQASAIKGEDGLR